MMRLLSAKMVEKVLTSGFGLEAVALDKKFRGSQASQRREIRDAAFLDLHMASPRWDRGACKRQMRHSRWNRTTPIILISDDQRPSAMRP